MEMCSRCGQNPAMVYVMKKDAEGQRSEGLCSPCAKKLGIPLPNNLPINEEMLQNLIAHKRNSKMKASANVQ